MSPQKTFPELLHASRMPSANNPNWTPSARGWAGANGEHRHYDERSWPYGAFIMLSVSCSLLKSPVFGWENPS